MADPRELSISRLIQASPETVWKIYTQRTGEWFCPRPWTTPVVDWDLRVGGRANIELASPEGERHPHSGVFLEVVPGRKLVSTGAFTEGWVPQSGDLDFVRIDTFEPEAGGTRYTSIARHWDEKTAEKHKAMGFEQGWGAVADQLAALAEGDTQ
ncbi:SRPBCC family protein [Brevundimonas sp.]|uniref:SRPBCC family protein n=1 Tax=Brevundimonas sp. TaxID=1871086 RepID=UPI003569022B